MAVISGGFLPIARYVQKTLQLDYAFANNLQEDADGNLTGATVGPVVTPQRKRTLMQMIADVEGCHVDQVIAVGDGANDIPMLKSAGLGVAFCAKPMVRAAYTKLRRWLFIQLCHPLTLPPSVLTTISTSLFWTG